MTDNQKIQSHILQKYQVLKKLGSGAYGHVWKIKSKQNGLSYAMKKIFEAFQHSTDAQRTFREISVLKKISHKNIVRLHQVINSKNGRDIYLVFQFMQTDLCNAIYQGILHKVHQKYIIYQMLLSLVYLHSAEIIHRDLKPSNILLKGDCSAKLCDFGLVRFIGNQNLYGNILTQGVATRWYRAPQVLLGSNSYDERADLWSLGCIIGQMMLKNPLFPGNSTIEQLQKILQFTGKPSLVDIDSIKCELAQPMINNIKIRSKSKKQYFSSSIDPQCISLICSLLQFNPNKRISAAQALKHSYLKQFYDLKDVKLFQGKMVLQVNDNIQLKTDQYKNIITKNFIQIKDLSARKLSAQKLGMAINITPSKTKRQIENQQQIQPQKFSDLKKNSEKRDSLQHNDDKYKGSSKGKYISYNKANPSNSRQKSDLTLFEQLIKGKSSSKGKNIQQKDGTQSKHSNSSLLSKYSTSFAGLNSGINKIAQESKAEIQNNQQIPKSSSSGMIVFRKSSKSKQKQNISINTKQHSYSTNNLNKANLLQKYEKKQVSSGVNISNTYTHNHSNHSSNKSQLVMKTNNYSNINTGNTNNHLNGFYPPSQKIVSTNINNGTSSNGMTSFSGLRKVSKLNR